MLLGRKTLLLQLFVSAGSILLSIAALKAIVFPLFLDIEHDTVELNQQRVIEALAERETFMMAMAGDYGGWDPTFAFVRKYDSTYVGDNVSIETIRKMGTDALMIVDDSGRIKAEVLADPRSDRRVLFGDLIIHPDAAIAALDASENAEARKIGIVQTHLYPMVFVSHPILPNSSQGKPRGSFLIGSFVTENYIAELSERLAVDVQAVYRNSADWPPPEELDDIGTTINDGENIISRQALTDVHGEPAMLLRIRTPTDVSSAGRQAVFLALVFLGFSSLVLLLLSHLSLKHMIVEPLGGLTRYIEKLRQSSDLSKQLSEARNDELGMLARQFNALIKQLGQSQDDMAKARDDALQAAQVKSQFLANMSHEIRTPMNGVVGMTELLLNSETLGKKERRCAETVRLSSQSLLNIINDILDFSKMEVGRMTLDSAPFDLRHCIEGTLDLLADSAHRKDIELICYIAPDLPENLIGDASRLRQVMTNLVGNAIKFTDAGEVFVSVTAEQMGDDRSTLEFAVRDTGIGISKADQSKIFESFSQADGAANRRFSGTGLGLAISRHIVSLVGSTIKLESEPGKGSTFSFSASFRHAHIQEKILPSLLAGKRVLIIDDNATNREILRAQAESWGIEVFDVDNGPDALTLLHKKFSAEESSIDFVILDFHMPGMDGGEVLSNIRNSSELQNIPLILLSSAAESLTPKDLNGLSPDAQLTKPVRQSHLRTCLESLVSPRKKDTVAVRTIEKQPINAHVLLAEDNAVNQLVATGMLEQLGCTLEIAADGAEAVAACKAGRYDLVLMDCQMPQLDGFEATRKIRAWEKSQNTEPGIIVAITANALKGDRERCIDAGMDDYLAKPFSLKELREKLEEQLPDRAFEVEPAPVAAEGH